MTGYSLIELMILGVVIATPIGFALATFIDAVQTAYDVKGPEVSVVHYDRRSVAQAQHSAHIIKGRVFR